MVSPAQTSAHAQFATKDALFNLLTAEFDARPEKVSVEWGYEGKPKKAAIHIGNIEGTEYPDGIGTTRPRESRFSIDVSVSFAARGTQREITRRCYELADIFGTILLAHPELDGQVDGHVLDFFALSDFDLREGATGDGGRIAYLDCEVEARTRLRIV